MIQPLLVLLFFTNVLAQINEHEETVGSPLSTLYLNRAKARLIHDLAKARHHLHLRPHLLLQPNPNFDNSEIQNYYIHPNNHHQIIQNPDHFQTIEHYGKLNNNGLVSNVYNDQNGQPEGFKEHDGMTYQNYENPQQNYENPQENYENHQQSYENPDQTYEDLHQNCENLDHKPQIFTDVPQIDVKINKPEDDYSLQLETPTDNSTNSLDDNYYSSIVDGEYLKAMDQKLIKLLQQIFGFFVYAELRKKANSTSIDGPSMIPDGQLNWPSSARTSVPFPNKPLSKEGQDFWRLVQKNIKTYAQITGPIDIINGTDRVLNITDLDSSIQFHRLKNSTEEVIHDQNTKHFDQKMTDHLRNLFRNVLQEQAKNIQNHDDSLQNDGEILQAVEETTENFIETTTFVGDDMKRNFTKRFEKLMANFMHKMFTYMMSEKVLDDIYSEENTGGIGFDTDIKLKEELLGAVRNMSVDYEQAGHDFYQYIKKHIRHMPTDGIPIDNSVQNHNDIPTDKDNEEHESITEDSTDIFDHQHTTNDPEASSDPIIGNLADGTSSNERKAVSEEDDEFEKKYRPRMTKLLDRMMKHMIRKEKFERSGQKSVENNVVPSSLRSHVTTTEHNIEAPQTDAPQPEVTTVAGSSNFNDDEATTTEETVEITESIINSKGVEVLLNTNEENPINLQARTHFKHGFSHFPVDQHVDHHHHHFQSSFPSHSQGFHNFPGDFHGHKPFFKPAPSHITINKQQNFVSPHHGHFDIGQNNQGTFNQFSSNHHDLFSRVSEDQVGRRQKRHVKHFGKPGHHGFQHSSFGHPAASHHVTKHQSSHHFGPQVPMHKPFRQQLHFLPPNRVKYGGLNHHRRLKRGTTQFDGSIPHDQQFFQPTFNHGYQAIPARPNHNEFPAHELSKQRTPEEQMLGYIIWAPRHHRVYKRSVPLLKLIADPDVKLDMSKTMENVGTIAKNSFEDQKAPMYHIRNMIGSAKNVILSTMKIPPQDAIIPSQYKILDRSNMKKLQAPQMRSRFKDTSESVDLSDQVVETFQRVGAMLRDSIKSGQEALQHMTDVAHSARKAVVTTGYSTPRFLMPYVKATAVKKERNPEKVMLIAPRIADVTREGEDGHLGKPDEEIIKIGDLMDAFGVSNPERKRPGLTRFVMHPKKPDFNLQSRFSGGVGGKRDENKYFITAENIDDGDDTPKSEFQEAVDTLKHINTVVGAKPLKNFLSKLKEELSKEPGDEMVTSNFIMSKDLPKPLLSKPEEEDSKRNLTTGFDPDEILKMADEDLKEILRMHNEQLEEEEVIEEDTNQVTKGLKELFQRNKKLKSVDLGK